MTYKKGSLRYYNGGVLDGHGGEEPLRDLWVIPR